MIFVTVGSQKFQFNRLLKKIDEMIDKKIIKDKVFAQIGASDYKPLNYEYVDFMNQEDFNKKLDECDLLITHAGTGVIVKREKKVIATPRLAKYGEHVDDHQIQLIQQFDELNFIEPLYDMEDMEEKLKIIKEKNYKKYVSNTDTIIDSIKNFIEG